MALKPTRFRFAPAVGLALRYTFKIASLTIGERNEHSRNWLEK